MCSKSQLFNVKTGLIKTEPITKRPFGIVGMAKKSVFGRTAAITAAGLCGVTLAFATTPTSAQSPRDGKIYAIYKVAFNGIKLGKFRFRSDVSEKHYTMNGNSEFTFLNGLLFEWKGSVHSSGALSNQGPKPDSFSYLSNANGEVETISMTFAKDSVHEVVAKPHKAPSKKAVPLMDWHLQNVVDPMTALMLLTDPKDMKPSGKEVCDRKMPIFDGKQRFDLKLSYKKQVRLDPKADNGFAGKAYVCKVKYHPIAGHKPGKSGTKYMAESNDIEVWLVPIAKAKMYVPYKIVLPTIAGYATATSVVFQIEQPSGERIAFNSH